MRNLHLEKQGIRGLAIAESFSQTSKKSVLSGIVMSTDLVIDGFVFGHSTVGGDDATDAILSMYEKLDRQDVSFLLISGIVISLYNIVDVKRISEKTGLPVSLAEDPLTSVVRGCGKALESISLLRQVTTLS